MKLPQIGAVLMALLLTALPALAQGDIILRADRADASDFPQVQVDLTIRDQYGVPVEGLTATDLAVTEDYGSTPRPITEVTTTVNADLPISVVVVLDISGSMAGQPLADAKTAALRFLDRLGAADQAALIAFADTVNLDAVDPAREQPFSDNIQGLYSLVESLRAGGDTPLYDVAYKAVQWAAERPAGNRAVLLLSDGKEDPGRDGKMGSHTANDDTAIRQANVANVPVFTIGLGKEIDEIYLRRLARETGGRYQPAPDSTSLVELFQNVADLLKQQIRVSYQSGVSGDGQEHTVRVLVRAQEREASGQATFVAPLAGPPTATQTPTATATATAVPTPTPSPTPSPTPAPPPPPPQSTWLWLAGAGGAALLLAAGIAGARLVARRKKPPVYRCLRCGHDLESPDAPCPSCGYQGSFRAPES